MSTRSPFEWESKGARGALNTVSSSAPARTSCTFGWREGASVNSHPSHNPPVTEAPADLNPIRVGILALLLVSLLFLPTRVASASEGATSPRPMDTTACNQVIALYPMLGNSSSATAGSVDRQVSQMFWAICQTPEFIALIQNWGASNFSLGFGFQGSSLNVTAAYYGVDWVAGCANPVYAQSGPCTYTEYWTGNISSGIVTGPVTIQYPDAVGGPAISPASPSFDGIFGVLAALAALLATAAIVVVVVHRARRGQVTQAESVLPPASAASSDESGSHQRDSDSASEPKTEVSQTQDPLDDIF